MISIFRLVFISLILMNDRVASENTFDPSLTCYKRYEHEETRAKPFNITTGYSYHEIQITQYVTAEGEQCAKVGCVCFSYFSNCYYRSPEPGHYAYCTFEDQQNRIRKWYRGLTSQRQCEKMRQQPQRYINLTCCYTDRCNDQSGETINMVDMPTQVLVSNILGQQSSYPPHSAVHSQLQAMQDSDIVQHPVTSRFTGTHQSSQSFNRHINYPGTTSSTAIRKTSTPGKTYKQNSTTPRWYQTTSTETKALLQNNSCALSPLPTLITIFQIAFIFIF